jgi:hypothetical protein
MRPFARCTPRLAKRGSTAWRPTAVPATDFDLHAVCLRRTLDALPGRADYQASTLEVLSAGTQTTVQDYPGAWATGPWACRRPGRWTAAPASGQPPAGQ